ncbi:MAG: phosphonatase-like hydrolase [Spirosomaceae bacterium]|jgi:phosphonatase-like hydrolase|nr:phosphonatase-like hydrolase [Spirosomataceae bacterium]
MSYLQLVVFDMAGTAIDEQNAVYKAIHQALEEAGYDCSLELVLEIAAGKEKRQAITDVLTHLIDDEPFDTMIDAIHEDFKQKLDVVYASGIARAMPDAVEVFEALRQKNIKVALNTGYSREVATLLMGQLGWSVPQIVDALVTASDVTRGRPNPDMILEAMRLVGVSDPKAVAKIGDSAIDIEEGHNAGCGLVAGVLTGAQTRTQLATAQPTHIFENLTELLGLI